MSSTTRRESWVATCAFVFDHTQAAVFMENDSMATMTVCPDCGAGVELIEMPGSGQSVRIECDECEHVFWFDGPPTEEDDD